MSAATDELLDAIEAAHPDEVTRSLVATIRRLGEHSSRLAPVLPLRPGRADVVADWVAVHLRSTSRPELALTAQGRIRVWTECGEQLDAVLVDNEVASCPRCGQVNAPAAMGEEAGR